MGVSPAIKIWIVRWVPVGAHWAPTPPGWETFGIGPRGVGADLSQVLMIGHNTKHCTMMFYLHAIVVPVFGFLFDCKLKVTDFDEI